MIFLRLLFDSELRTKVASLNNNDETLVPIEYINEHIIPQVKFVFITLSTIYILTLTVISHYVLTTPESRTMQRRHKFAYQMTNLLTNTVLGVGGLYYEFIVQPWHVPLLERITEFDQYDKFTTLQLGFQLWALPVGYLFAGEETTMIVHHIAVILMCGMSGFFRNGFRYYTPFCYGAIELSSVPLSIMNSFKQNPHWIENHLKKYLWTRLIFSIMFLLLRIVLFMPRILTVLFCEIILTYASTNRYYQAYMLSIITSTTTLLLLQVYWGSIIVKGLLNHFFPNLLPSLFGTPKEKEKSS